MALKKDMTAIQVQAGLPITAVYAVSMPDEGYYQTPTITITETPSAVSAYDVVQELTKMRAEEQKAHQRLRDIVVELIAVYDCGKDHDDLLELMDKIEQLRREL